MVELWRKCKLKNIAGPRLGLLKSMFDRAEVAVRVSGKESRCVKMGRGCSYHPSFLMSSS